MKRQCPICHALVQPLTTNKAFPFCTPRCKKVDLGNWFAEDYVLSRPIDPERDHDTVMSQFEEEAH